MTDSGLFSHLLDVRNVEQLIASPRKGDIVETFVYSELLKHIDYSCKQPQIYHYRTNDKKEIDFIIEKAGTIFAVEVKSSQSVKNDAFRHIADFQKRSSGNITGIVLYAGDTLLSFGDEFHNRYAVPMNIFF